MLKQALMGLVTDVILGLAEDLYEALKDSKDANQRKAKLRGVLKARLHEEAHNAIARALR